MESLPQDILVTIVEKLATQDPDAPASYPSEVLRHLRLVSKRFYAAVQGAAFALRPSTRLTYNHLPELGHLFPNLTEINITRCTHLPPSSLRSLQATLPMLSGIHFPGNWLAGPRRAHLANLPLFSRLKTLDLYNHSDALRPLPESLFSPERLPSLQTLTLSECSSMVALPQGITRLALLTSLTLEGFPYITEIPEGISALSNLARLSLSRFPLLSDLPVGFGALTGLDTLMLRMLPRLAALPDSISGLASLTCVNILCCDELVGLPDSALSGLSSLRHLGLIISNSFAALPESVSCLCSLTSLALWQLPALSGLPDAISALTRLGQLSIFTCPSFTCLPPWVGELPLLTNLHVGSTPITSLPESLGRATSLKRLILTGWFLNLTFKFYSLVVGPSSPQ